MRFRLIFWIVLLQCVGTATDLETARILYYKAVDGERSAGTDAIAMFDQLRKGRPEDPVLMAYRGSLSLLESSWALAPWKKGRLAKDGLQMMDKAVGLAPQDLEVRFVRAASTMGLPGFFRRGDESASDFATLAPRVAEAVRAGKLEARLGTAALYSHAQNRLKAGDHAGGQQACSLAVNLAPNTAGAKACAAQLAKPQR